jgi:hypothetical protein
VIAPLPNIFLCFFSRDHARDRARKAKASVGQWRDHGRDNGREKREWRRPFRSDYKTIVTHEYEPNFYGDSEYQLYFATYKEDIYTRRKTNLANVSRNGVGSLTRNRGRLLEKGARKRFRPLPFRAEKRGDSQFMEQNERH